MLEIEHLRPTAKGGSDTETNLWLACRLCNGTKGVQTEALDPLTRRTVSLFNPRAQVWSEHFRWKDAGVMVVGKTACGRATVHALQLNNEILVNVRRRWAAVGWFPFRKQSPIRKQSPKT
jgi:hypothetical protein